MRKPNPFLNPATERDMTRLLRMRGKQSGRGRFGLVWSPPPGLRAPCCIEERYATRPQAVAALWVTALQGYSVDFYRIAELS